MDGTYVWNNLANGQLPPDSSVWGLIVDFEDALMSTGTRGDEQRFTAAEVIDDKSAIGS